MSNEVIEEEEEEAAEDHNYAESLPSDSGDSKSASSEFTFPPEIVEPKIDVPVDPIFDEGNIIQEYMVFDLIKLCRSREHNVRFSSKRK